MFSRETWQQHCRCCAQTSFSLTGFSFKDSKWFKGISIPWADDAGVCFRRGAASGLVAFLRREFALQDHVAQIWCFDSALDFAELRNRFRFRFGIRLICRFRLRLRLKFICRIRYWFRLWPWLWSGLRLWFGLGLGFWFLLFFWFRLRLRIRFRLGFILEAKCASNFWFRFLFRLRFGCWFRSGTSVDAN